MNPIFKKSMPYITAAAVFILLAVIYCSPVLQGKVIYAADSVQPRAAVQESVDYFEKTGNRPFWTGSMFSGMPNYQIGGGKTVSEEVTSPLMKVVRWGHRNQIAILLFYFIAFFALMRAFGVNVWLSIAGALAVGFSSYFFIIIAASHNGKTTSIIWMTMALVGMLLIFKKKYFTGAITVMLSLLAGLTVHPQMSYYVGLLIGLVFLAEVYIHITEKRVKDLLIGTVIFVAAFVVGVGTESGRVFANLEYTEQTMRGGHSELVKEKDGENKTKGLDFDYATQWSYGIDESMTFLIPNFKGGSSGYTLGENSNTYKALIDNRVPRNSAREFVTNNLPTYWGTQPFTSGPVYMGAIVMFLFVLSLFVVKGPYKWALLAATIFSILLSWGHNFTWLSKLFFDYFPMYNKFRAVSSILIVAEITIPLLGFLALKAIMEKQITTKKLLKYIQISAGITGGICLFFALFGGMIYNFSSPNDAQVFSQFPEWLGEAILADRASMLRGDAFRSLIFIVLGMALLWLFVKEKIKLGLFVAILSVLIVADMWTVNKRFLNDGHFKPEREMKNAFAMQPYEKMILDNDKDSHFRVLNLTVNPFSESRTSYYLKSVGGYSAAKLRRYQDLIDQHISKMNMEVLNMLNTKYFIVADNDKNPFPQYNPDAFGNAWFVDSLKIVDTPNEESDALNEINLRNTAVLDKQFATFTNNFVTGHDSTAQIHLTKYTPEYIEYESNSDKDGTVVFSEIYYPYGWKAYIDGEFVEHFRVNYMLRALNVPAGQHHIRFEFRPDSIKKGDTLALASLGIIVLTILAGVGYWFWQKKKKEKK
jgi:Predicted membrane protein